MPPKSSADQQKSFCASLLTLEKIRGHFKDSENLNFIKGEPNTVKKGEEDKMLLANIVSWISQCLVEREKGDVIAVSISVKSIAKEKVGVHVYISDNDGNRPSGTENWTTIIGKIEEALNRGNQFNADEATNRIMNTLLITSSERLWKKISNIRASGAAYRMNTMSTLTRLVDLWYNLQDKENLDGLFSKSFIEAAHIRRPNDNTSERLKDQLLYFMNQLITMSKPADTFESKKQRYDFAMLSCREILDSPFMRDFGDEELLKRLKLQPEIKKFISRFHRRLWKVLRFRAGAQETVDEGLGLFRRLSKTKEQATVEIGFTYIGGIISSLGRDQGRHTISREDFESWLQPKADQIRLSENVRADCIHKVIGDGPRTLYPKLHCEIALMHAVITGKAKSTLGVIGVSKLMCTSCFHYYNGLTGALSTTPSKMNFFISGTSGKAHHNWLIPNEYSIPTHDANLKNVVRNATMAVTRGVEAELLAALRGVKAEEIVLDGYVSDGSDTSSGSNSRPAATVRMNAIYILENASEFL